MSTTQTTNANDNGNGNGNRNGNGNGSGNDNGNDNGNDKIYVIPVFICNVQNNQRISEPLWLMVSVRALPYAFICLSLKYHSHCVIYILCCRLCFFSPFYFSFFTRFYLPQLRACPTREKKKCPYNVLINVCLKFACNVVFQWIEVNWRMENKEERKNEQC